MAELNQDLAAIEATNSDGVVIRNEEQVMDLTKGIRTVGRLFFITTFSLASSAMNAKELDPTQLIEQMSKEIAGLQSFILQGHTSVDARLEAGQIIEHSSQIMMRVVRPGSIHITNKSLETTKEIYFEDHLITIYDSSTGFYGQKQFPSEVESPLIYAIDNLGIDVPLIDFLDQDLTRRLVEDASEVQYLGESLMRDRTYHHIGIRMREVDIQLWIEAKGPPLPGKLVISAKWEGGAPRTVSFMDWRLNPKISAQDLKFEVPEGAVKIEIQSDQ